MATIKRYGLIDDFGEVIRWLDYQPKHGEYITKVVQVPKRASAYDLAMAACGEALI